MQTTDIPEKFLVPIASANPSYTRHIPVTSQIGVVNGAASIPDGFVPLNATPIGAGGIPPDIKDMNGFLLEISAWSRWQAAGGPIFFDGTFATAVGGYPKGAILSSPTTVGTLYVSNADGNVTNPEGTGGAAAWTTLVAAPATLAELITGTSTVKFVTPAALAGLRASSAAIIAGTDPASYITPAALYGARASAADVNAGTDDHKFVTAAALAASNSSGVLHFPGGIIMQYGVDSIARSEGLQAIAFNTPFPTAVDCVIPCPINDSGGTANTYDQWCQWKRTAGVLSTFSFIVQSANGYGGSISGTSWVAFGR